MRFAEIAQRLNGVTVGPFGAQWVAKPADAEIARRAIRFLEDRRVLYNDYAWGYGIELDPKYIDVIVTRWQNFTGARATLGVGGQTFDQVKDARLGIAA